MKHTTLTPYQYNKLLRKAFAMHLQEFPTYQAALNFLTEVDTNHIFSAADYEIYQEGTWKIRVRSEALQEAEIEQINRLFV